MSAKNSIPVGESNQKRNSMNYEIADEADFDPEYDSAAQMNGQKTGYGAQQVKKTDMTAQQKSGNPTKNHAKER
jgi:hypothetical protein